MNIRQALSIAIALSAATGGFALAQGDGDGVLRYNEQMQRVSPLGDQQGRRGAGLGPGRRGNYQQREYERGAGPDRQWHRGDRLPPEYRHRNYVVDDWRGHRLSAPPRGYQWVQYGNDYVLVAIATGIIAQLLLDNR